ncbi:MAG: fibronectin type III domain-containing protein [Chitinophaga sp.]|uniref:fibronectin type III domain-containing protein n=1 Tax=Chitinophaga sp. TaxID=1869181 RepID=UPI0025BC2455|nr:fibronectin type III domain-containing protein [Chitinophaga sp.]MBV8252074.1 fibronectin type III domain-containing protein [Chitinophaga sp.]
MAYLLSCLLICSGSLQAQSVWPTQVNTIILPPYSPFTSDYVNVPNKMTVNLFLRDINASNVKVRLRLSITGQATGIKITTNPQANTPILTLDGGVPVRLSDADLEPYFRTENLTFSGITAAQYSSSGGKMPEDFYRICFEAYELRTGAKISVTNGCANAWIMLNDPPFLNTPSNNVQLAVKQPTTVSFQWTPRHKGSPNAAFATEYLLQLTELMPGFDNNPQAAFLASRPLFETTVPNTMYVYGLQGEIPLEAGRKYAWRVRCVPVGELQQLDLFKNNGYSEIFTFTYKGSCPDPIMVTAKTKGNTRLEVTWTAPDPNQQEFVVAYRKAGLPNAAWFEEKTLNTSLTIYDLSPNTSYEYKVRCNCADGGESGFSPVQTVATPAETQTNYTCGAIAAPIAIKNMNPLNLLMARDEIKAGDFAVKLTKVSGSRGTFSGEGYITVPYLNNARIAVYFENVFVNSDYELAKGEVRTKYDPEWKSITDLDTYFEGGGNTGKVVTGNNAADIEVGVVINRPEDIKVTINSDHAANPQSPAATITITGSNGETITKSVDKLPTTIKDKDGNIYQADESGKVTQVAKGGANAASQLPPPQERNTLHPDKAVVKFMAYPEKQTYAFDEWDPVYTKSLLFGKSYEKLSDDYYVSAKAIIAAKVDVVKAVMTVTDPAIIPDSIQFITGKGTRYLSKLIGKNTYEITVVGGPANDAQELFAVYTPKDGKPMTLGKLLITAYTEKQRKVFLVPVNGAAVDKDDIRATLQRVYGPLGINWEVEVDKPLTDMSWDLDGDEALNVEGSGLTDTQTREMKALNEALSKSRTIDDKAVYLFVLKSGKGKDKLLSGDMPRNRQFGYLFTDAKSNLGQTIAHELGHGVFHLKHTFDGYGFRDNDLTDNLMNYSQGTKLTKFQWDAIHDPGVVWGIFEKDAATEQQAVRIKELLAWIRSNKGKATQFDRDDYFLGVDPRNRFYRNRVDLTDGSTVDLFADVYGKGEVDLTLSNERYNNLYAGVGIPSLGKDLDYGKVDNIPFRDEYHTVFYLGIYYKDRHGPAIQLYTHSYEEYKLLLKDLQLDIEPVKPAIINLYKKAFELAGDDCDKVDVVYENIPDFVISERSDTALWDALVSLSKCMMDETGTNEELGALNILKSFKNQAWLFQKLKDNPAVVLDLRHRLDDKMGDKNAKAFATFLLNLANRYWTTEQRSTIKHDVFWGDDHDKPGPFHTILMQVEEVGGDQLSIVNAFGRVNLIPLTYQVGEVLGSFNCGLFEPVRLHFINSSESVLAPGIYLYYLGVSKNLEEAGESIMTDLNFLGATSSIRILLTKGAPTLLRVVAAIQLVKMPVDAALNSPKVRQELMSTDAGKKFLDVWPVISIGMDISLISTDILYNFAKSSAAAKAALRNQGYGDAANDLERVEEAVTQHTNTVQQTAQQTAQRAITHMNPGELDNLTAVTSVARADSRAINKVPSLVNEGKAVVVAPQANTVLKQKVDDYLTAYTAGTTARQGELGEEIAELLSREMNPNAGSVVNVKINNSGHGFDVLSLEPDINNPTVVRMFECKPMTNGSVALPSTNKGMQMSQTWIDGNIELMVNSTNTELNTLGHTLERLSLQGRIEKYVVTVDKELGQVIIFKLDNF